MKQLSLYEDPALLPSCPQQHFHPSPRTSAVCLLLFVPVVTMGNGTHPMPPSRKTATFGKPNTCQPLPYGPVTPESPGTVPLFQ